jgi:DNA adenine methylase
MPSSSKFSVLSSARNQQPLMIPSPVSARNGVGAPQTISPTARVRPFLKWAGGKRQVLPHLRQFVPPTFARYVEPFLGSAALFLDLHARGAIESHQVVLGDTNADLVGTYAAVARDVDAVIRALRKLVVGHASGGEKHYYRVRDTLFNPQRRKLDILRTEGSVTYPATLAAMFLYLNRTGFNGLYRLNTRGDFNVPAGRYANPLICDAQNLRTVATVLQSPAVELHHSAFDATVSRCAAGDFVYFDPPYAPLSSTANFTSYTAQGFDDANQRRLQRIVIDLVQRGCFVVLSNSTAPLITALYETDIAAKRAGLRAYRVPARRAINSNASRRGTIEEYVITNVRPVG